MKKMSWFLCALVLVSLVGTGCHVGVDPTGTQDAALTSGLDLSVVHTANPTNVPAATGGSYEVLVKNVGTASTQYPVQVVERLDTITSVFQGYTGTGWSCTPSSSGLVMCTHMVTLAPNQSLPLLTISYQVRAGASGKSGACAYMRSYGDVNGANNTDCSVVYITP